MNEGISMNTQNRLKQLEAKDIKIGELIEFVRVLSIRLLKLEDIHEDEGYQTLRPKRQSHARIRK